MYGALVQSLVKEPDPAWLKKIPHATMKIQHSQIKKKKKQKTDEANNTCCHARTL